MSKHENALVLMLKCVMVLGNYFQFVEAVHERYLEERKFINCNIFTFKYYEVVTQLLYSLKNIFVKELLFIKSNVVFNCIEHLVLNRE